MINDCKGKVCIREGPHFLGLINEFKCAFDGIIILLIIFENDLLVSMGVICLVSFDKFLIVFVETSNYLSLQVIDILNCTLN